MRARDVCAPGHVTRPHPPYACQCSEEPHQPDQAHVEDDDADLAKDFTGIFLSYCRPGILFLQFQVLGVGEQFSRNRVMT